MPKRPRQNRPAQDDAPLDQLRIIGGRHRGRKLRYEPLTQADGGRVTRPMKHRVREAIFNLVGPRVKGMHAIDLFAGTGALGLEALSRGAQSATFIERHLPTADVLRDNIRTLDLEGCSQLHVTSAFLWLKRDLASESTAAPWLMFVSPPYAFFADREEEMLDSIARLLLHAPPSSVMVVEADDRFDFSHLPGNVKATRYEDGWDVRKYSPAVVGVIQTPGSGE